MSNKAGIILFAAAVLLLCPARSGACQSGSAASQPYTTYIVKWYESLDDVAVRFGVSKEVLMAFNGLQSEKLSRKQELKIPSDPSSVDLTPPPAEPGSPVREPATAPADSSAVSEVPAVPIFVYEEEPEEDPVQHTNHINAALLLPLGGQSARSEGAYEYYCGAMIALRDLSDTGLDIRLDVSDCVTEGISHEWLNSKDLIIGPFAPAQLEAVAAMYPDVPVVSPLDPKGLSLADSLQNVIQAPSPAALQYQDAVEWMLSDMQEEDRIILLREAGVEATPIAELLTAADVTYGALSYGILEGRGAISRLEKMMTKTGINRVIIASENEAFVNDALRNANLMKFREYETVLYSTSKIRNFETIEVENLHNVHAHISCTYFTDYNSDNVKSFLMRYRALYGAEPSRFAMQGYDSVRFFLRAFATEGSLEARKAELSQHRERGIQSDFNIAAHGQGCANSAIRRIIYNDGYSISLL